MIELDNLITIGSFILAVIVTGYILFKKPAMTNELLQALEQFAKDAVVVAEKAGLTDKLLDKKRYAIQKLQSMLESAGFSKQDEHLLASCIEHAYVALKNDMENAYKGGAVNEENK